MARSTSSSVAAPGPAVDAVRGRSLALNLLVSLRPAEWTKNLFVFAGLLFGLKLFDPNAIVDAVGAFVVFCVLSGVVYLVNDITDRESDRQHPIKTKRPIASGALPAPAALAAAIALGICGLSGAVVLGRPFAVVAVAYVALHLAYSFSLKHIVIIDVLTIAVGFVLRAVAGAEAVHVDISNWLLVCTILIALFIGLAKRRHEIVLLAGGATSHRPILGEYSAYLLDQMIGVVTASVVAFGPTIPSLGPQTTLVSPRGALNLLNEADRLYIGDFRCTEFFGTSIWCISARAAAAPPTCC